MGWDHSKEAQEEALNAQDTKADSEVIGPRRSPERSSNTACRSCPTLPKANSEDEDKDGQTVAEDRMQFFWQAAKQGVGGDDCESEEDAAHSSVPGQPGRTRVLLMGRGYEP